MRWGLLAAAWGLRSGLGADPRWDEADHRRGQGGRAAGAAFAGDGGACPGLTPGFRTQSGAGEAWGERQRQTPAPRSRQAGVTVATQARALGPAEGTGDRVSWPRGQ